MDSTAALNADGRSHSGPLLLHEQHEGIKRLLDVILLLLEPFGPFTLSTGHKMQGVNLR